MKARQLLPLLGLAVFGAVVSYLLQDSRPLGRNVSESAAAMRILDGEGAPQTMRGDGDLTMAMFTDYQCPACRKAAPALRAALESDGNVRIVYKEWPIFGPVSERAAKVALAADYQGLYPAVHRALMQSRSLDDSALRRAVESAGGDWRQLQADLAAHEAEIEAHLAASSQDAFRLGLSGTPSYLIGPLLIEGALSEDEFLRAFEEARSQR